MSGRPSRETASSLCDLGRILAITAIFYYHVGISAGYAFSAWGEYGVSCFIIFSAFSYFYFSSVRPHDAPSYWKFFFRRLRSIFPLFLVVNVALFGVSFFYPSATGERFSLLDFLLSTSGLSQYLGFRYLTRTMWFIPFIVQAYLLLPWLDRAIDKLRPSLGLAAAYALSASLSIVVFVLWPAQASEICRNWSPVFRLPELVLGAIIGQALANQITRRETTIAVLIYILGAALARFGPRFADPSEEYISSLTWNGLCATAAILAVAGSIHWALRRLDRRPDFRTWGQASFGFFLIHGAGILFVYRHFGGQPLPWIVYYFVCWIIALALMTGTNYLDGKIPRSGLA